MMDFSWLTDYIKSFLSSESSTLINLKNLLLALLVSSAVIYAGIKAKGFLETPEEIEEFLDEELVEEQVSEEDAPEEQELISSEDSYEQCKSNTLPSFINVSTSWGEPDNMDALSAFQSLSPPSVIITSAGSSANDVPPRPQIDPNKERGSKEFDAILVGSVDPHGNRSHFSQRGGEVTILAPSNHQLSTVDGEGNYKKFGGTSGATALVTGSLAGFSQLSGYQPTAEEAKILLEKTAIPVRASQTRRPLMPRENGAGMVNAYKLGMVAKRLKEECGDDIYCFKNKIREHSTYVFPEDEGLFEAVEEAFPECSADKCLERSDSCPDKEAAFKRLRKAAFLKPNNMKIWRYVSCIYASSGFPDNARGIRNIYNANHGAFAAETPFERHSPFKQTYCQTNEDCALVPECLDAGNNTYLTPPYLTAVNKHYSTECQGPVLCNGKCRCDREEESFIWRPSENGGQQQHPIILYTRCVDSKCVKNLRPIDRVEPDIPRDGGSGQR